jgi:hypothetical protein
MLWTDSPRSPEAPTPSPMFTTPLPTLSRDDFGNFCGKWVGVPTAPCRSSIGLLDSNHSMKPEALEAEELAGPAAPVWDLDIQAMWSLQCCGTGFFRLNGGCRSAFVTTTALTSEMSDCQLS